MLFDFIVYVVRKHYWTIICTIANVWSITNALWLGYQEIKKQLDNEERYKQLASDMADNKYKRKKLQPTSSSSMPPDEAPTELEILATHLWSTPHFDLLDYHRCLNEINISLPSSASVNTVTQQNIDLYHNIKSVSETPSNISNNHQVPEFNTTLCDSINPMLMTQCWLKHYIVPRMEKWFYWKHYHLLTTTTTTDKITLPTTPPSTSWDSTRALIKMTPTAKYNKGKSSPPYGYKVRYLDIHGRPSYKYY